MVTADQPPRPQHQVDNQQRKRSKLSWPPPSTATPPLVVEWSTRCRAPTTLQPRSNKPGLEPQQADDNDDLSA
ncbi:hypothetical protein BKA81DRAFT_55410 [Phyllosticta paracitricarpa]